MEQNKKIKVVVSAIWYPLCMASYFVRALQRRDDIDLTLVGPFTGNNIPWDGGLKLPMKYVVTPDVPLPAGMAGISSLPFGMVSSQIHKKPDLWLQVDAGFHFKDRPDAGVTALVKTDPHVLTPHYNEIAGVNDFSFGMQTPYMQPGDIYLPYAYDPEYHSPIQLDKEFDGCLIGLHYQQRDALVNLLRMNGFHIYYSIGEIYREYQLAYNRSRIALSWSSLSDLPARVWESLGMGLPLLTNKVPDLDNFFEDGTHYIGFTSLEDAANKFRMLMEDKELRDRIASNGHDAVTAKHTWDHRIQTILEVTGLV